MAKIHLRPPAYTVPTVGQRAYAYGNNQTGNLALTLQRKRRRARYWPSFPFDPPPWQFPLDSNRAFARWARRAWLEILSPANRAAWNALAPSVFIQNFRLQTKSMPGFYLFQYYHHAWRWWWLTPCLPFHPESSTPELEPFLPWSPPGQPFDFTILEQYPHGMKIEYHTSPSYTYQLLVTQVATKRSRRNPTLTTAFVNLPVPTSYTFYPPNTWETTITWHGLLPIPPEPGDRAFRFRCLLNADPWTPGYRRRVILTLT